MSKTLFEKENELFLQVYNRIPIDIDYGKGCYLFDKEGNKYLDFFTGLAVNALGYSHPKIIEAVTRQIQKFAHLSNNFITDIQITFAEKLLKYSGMDKIFLTNSGTEAVEGAIKIVRKNLGPDKKIISFSNGFHGRTYGAMSLTAKEKYRKGFEPLLPNTQLLPYNNTEELFKNIDENIAAIFLEFIQGEGGINEASCEFVRTIFELKSKYDFIVVSDCIQCGTGRTGKPYSHNHYNVEPDIIVTAKAIGGGLPLGAILMKDKLTKVFSKGVHGTTFGGNPVAVAAGLVVLEEVYENGLMEKVNEYGEYFKNKLIELKSKYSEKIIDVRGKGFMLGIELAFTGEKVVAELFKRKILSNCTNEKVIRILPPLIATKNEIDIYLENLDDILYKID